MQEFAVMFILDNRKWTASYVKDKNGKVWTQAAQTLWEFVGLWIYKRMYENKQNTS